MIKYSSDSGLHMVPSTKSQYCCDPIRKCWQGFWPILWPTPFVPWYLPNASFKSSFLRSLLNVSTYSTLNFNKNWPSLQLISVESWNQDAWWHSEVCYKSINAHLAKVGVQEAGQRTKSALALFLAFSVKRVPPVSVVFKLVPEFPQANDHADAVLRWKTFFSTPSCRSLRL